MPATLYEVRISLTGAKPPVWRRVRVDPDRSLGHLHEVIQSAMGWGREHLHGFELKRKGFPRRLFCSRGHGFDGSRDEDEDAVTLRSVCPRAKDTLQYEYDFGDSWRHRVAVSKVVDAEAAAPVCLSGKGACPPEDCGGVWGYGHLLEALADPKHPDNAEVTDLWGDDLDPGAFSLEAPTAGSNTCGPDPPRSRHRIGPPRWSRGWPGRRCSAAST